MTNRDYSFYSLNSPSTDFIDLCEFQLSLWGKAQKADWSAVYLTQENPSQRDPALIPVAVYPRQSEGKKKDTPLLSDTNQDKLILSSSSLTQALPNTFEQLIKEAFEDSTTHQVVLPLIYQERVLGLLVTRRKGEEWQTEEIDQGEKIAQSLAIACLLDQRQAWYQQQLQQQQNQQQWEETQIDNLLHQLRNPLTAIRTFSKLLLKRLNSDEKSQTAVQGVIREGDRLQDLLQTFEQDWKATHPDIQPTLKALPASSTLLLPSSTLSLQSVNLLEILQPLLTSAQAIAQEKHIQLDHGFTENNIHVRGNSSALREVFTNLLDNAIKYTPYGGQVSVTLLEDQENYIGVAIADTGYGIPPEDINRIFERHYRGVQEKGSIPGTGLGLSIVKDFIAQMNGKIEVISPNGLTEAQKGTTFIVWLVRGDRE